MSSDFMSRRRTKVAVSLALSAIVVSCSSSAEVVVSPSVLEPISTDTAPILPDDTSTPTPVSPSLDATLGEPVNGWSQPVDLSSWAGRETHVVERTGLVRRMNDDGSPGDVLLDMSTLTRAEGERGLLGLAYSPDGTRAFVDYTDVNGDTVIDRYDVGNEGEFDQSSRVELLTITQPYSNHNGGDLAVTADGRHLFVFTGDGGSAGDPDRDALDPESLLGKVLRLDPSTDDPTPEIWAVGLRNPWRVSVDPFTNDIWIADVGQGEREEVNVIDVGDLQGSSFGWSAREGTRPFNADQSDRHSAYRDVAPVFEYEHVDGDCSISGGAVMRDTTIDTVGDWYLFSDFCSGVVRALCVEPGGIDTCGLLALGKVPSSVGVLSDHLDRMWVLSLDGYLVPITAP
ncbi:MAG: PQQ-dependent sugar dehydrogenase [Ilumatobacteraceae bacterium]